MKTGLKVIYKGQTGIVWPEGMNVGGRVRVELSDKSVLAMPSEIKILGFYN